MPAWQNASKELSYAQLQTSRIDIILISELKHCIHILWVLSSFAGKRPFILHSNSILFPLEKKTGAYIYRYVWKDVHAVVWMNVYS